MTLPGVVFTETDGGLGIQPASNGRLLAFVGPATAGTKNQPSTFARVKDLVAAFGAGPTVEAAAHAIDAYGSPICIVRSDDAAGSVSSVTSVATGSAAVTIAASPTPNDDYDLVLKIVKGGTRGTAGITYQLSYDGGRTFDPETPLGTATSITVPGAGGVAFSIATGTLVAGDTFSARTTAPAADATDVGDALDALKLSQVAWEQGVICSPLDASIVDALETKFAGMQALHKPRNWIGAARTPNLAESEATYLTALTTIFGAKSSKVGSICAGSCKVASGVSGRNYRRSILLPVAARSGNVKAHINIAAVNLGALPGVSLADSNGNPDDHDESLYPGLDDARFITLRSIEGYGGAYVTLPRLFSPADSDFQLIPHRRVINVAYSALYAYFMRRVNSPILVSKRTGKIAPTDLSEMQNGALNALRTALLADPMASDVSVVISKDDNVLATSTIHVTARIVPLGYPREFDIDLGYYNPAMQLLAAA